MNIYCKLFGALLVLALANVAASSAVREEARENKDEQKNEEQESQIQKRSLEEGSQEEMAILKDLILSHVVSEMQSLREKQQEEDLKQQEKEEPNESSDRVPKKKRFFHPLTGRREDLPAIKRQIRYHQCYFNPISCFRRK